MPGQDYYSMIQLEELAKARRAKLAAEMTHQPPPINPYDGLAENFALGVREGPGEMAGLFDIAADYSTPGMFLDAFAPTDTTLKSSVDQLMNLAEVKSAYDELGPYDAPQELQSLSRFGGSMVSDPLMIAGGGLKGAEMGGKGTREALNWLAENSAGSPMAGQKGAITYQGSKAQYDALDHSFLGTGEGKNVYGRGSYLTENPYLSIDHYGRDGYHYEVDLPDDVIARMPDFNEPYRGLDGKTQAAVKPLYDELTGNFDPNGRRPEDIEMLDYFARGIDSNTGFDEWAEEMNPTAGEYLDAITESYNGGVPIPFSEMSIGTIHELMSARYGAEEAAKRMMDAGIPGFKYRDMETSWAGARSNTEGRGINYVVFDEKTATPVSRSKVSAGLNLKGRVSRQPPQVREALADLMNEVGAEQPMKPVPKHGDFGTVTGVDMVPAGDDASTREVYDAIVAAVGSKKKANELIDERLGGALSDRAELPRSDGAQASIRPEGLLGDAPNTIGKGQRGAIGTAQGSRLGEIGSKRDTSPIVTPEQLGDVKRGKRISTGSVTDVQAEATGFHSRDDMGVGVAEMKANPKAFKVNMDLVRDYPSIPTRKRAPDAVALEAQELMAANLDYLLDLAPNDFAPRSGNWYKGANALANDISNAYDVPVETSAAVLARLSPGADWLHNVEQADRLVSVWKHQQDTPLPDAALERAQKYMLDKHGALTGIKAKGRVIKDLSYLKGKRLGDLDDPVDQAIWFRAYNETSAPDQTYLGLTPEGATTDVQWTKGSKGSPAKPADYVPQSFDNLATAFQILEDQSIENISKRLGKGHKIRNFYNNIADPLNPEDLTADTHAVSAGLLTPYSQKGIPVGHNFGGGAVKGVVRGSAQSGQASGTYGLYADAYRQAAQSRGIIPQAMQSPTWELIRENFPTTGAGKANLEPKVDMIWKMVAAGRITPEQAREQIIDVATKGKGLLMPEWYGK